VKSVAVEPKSAIAIRPVPPASGGWKAYAFKAKPGALAPDHHLRGRLDQTSITFVTKPAAEVVADMGRFLTTRQWFVDPTIRFIAARQ